MKLLITQSSPLPIPWSLLGPCAFLSTHILECLQPVPPTPNVTKFQTHTKQQGKYSSIYYNLYIFG
jgi:hypothetical protein